MARHPFDPELTRNGWRRVTVDDLTTQQDVRLVTWVPTGKGEIPTIAIIDVRLQMHGALVRGSVVTQPVPDFAKQLAAATRIGTPPVSLGLTECDCPNGTHWNPYMLPLMWVQSMNDLRKIGELAQRYSTLLRTSHDWKCQNLRPAF